MNSKLYVGNLAYETTQADLDDLFSAAGTVREAVVISDKFSGRSRGFGFVTMGSAEEAEAAVAKFNDQELQGRKLAVNVAREREERAGSGRPSRPARRY